MPKPFRPLAIAVIASLLAACGTINEKVAAGAGDYVPQWLGGLPADAPPRPGTAKYDAWMKERERQRLMPAAEREKNEKAQQPASKGQQPGSKAQQPASKAQQPGSKGATSNDTAH